jgi:putative transposase
MGTFLALAGERYTRTGPRCFARESARAKWPRTDSFRRDHRYPIGEDDAKRGRNGYDAGKKIKGRKRHLVVDTLGLVLAVVVHSAGIQDRDGAKLALQQVLNAFPRLRLIWADGGYAGQLIAWVAAFGGWVLEIVKRSDDVKGFVVLPRRWVVERTFGWLMKFRRLCKDYEETTKSSEAWIRLAMIHIMARRLATST